MSGDKLNETEAPITRPKVIVGAIAGAFVWWLMKPAFMFGIPFGLGDALSCLFSAESNSCMVRGLATRTLLLFVALCCAGGYLGHLWDQKSRGEADKPGPAAK